MGFPQVGNDVEKIDSSEAHYYVGDDQNIYLKSFYLPQEFMQSLGFNGGSDLESSFPLRHFFTAEYGDNYNGSTNYVALVHLSPTLLDGIFSIDFDIEKDVSVDAFGELQLPNGGNTEVLRYTEIEHSRIYCTLLQENGDTIFPEPIVDTTILRTIHRFYSKQIDYPIATVTTIDVEGETIVDYIEYVNLTASGLTDFFTESAANCVIYPNPISETELNIEYAFEGERSIEWQVCDLSGRVLFEEKGNFVDGFQESFDVDHLPPSTYFFRLLDENQLIQRRFVVQ